MASKVIFLVKSQHCFRPFFTVILKYFCGLGCLGVEHTLGKDKSSICKHTHTHTHTLALPPHAQGVGSKEDAGLEQEGASSGASARRPRSPPHGPRCPRCRVYLGRKSTVHVRCDWEVERGLGLDRERSYTHDDSKLANAAAQRIYVCVCSVAHYDDLHACVAVTIVISICVSSYGNNTPAHSAS